MVTDFPLEPGATFYFVGHASVTVAHRLAFALEGITKLKIRVGKRCLPGAKTTVTFKTCDLEQRDHANMVLCPGGDQFVLINAAGRKTKFKLPALSSYSVSDQVRALGHEPRMFST